MKRSLVIFALLASTTLWAQREREKEEDEKENRSPKENLFTGGSISLAFYNNTFLLGASPVFGYSLTNWIDAGIVVNYNYTSYRDYQEFDDRLRQYVYGGGVFLKIYPVRFLFAQAQFEHNIIKQKYIPAPGSIFMRETVKANANSFLIGAGYTTGREGRGGGPHYYLSVLFDVMKELTSPYTDGAGRTIPIIRGGIQVPLFQGSNRYGRR